MTDTQDMTTTEDQLAFTNGRTASHLLVSDSGKVHYAEDCQMRPYHVLACNGRAIRGGGMPLHQLRHINPTAMCSSCSKLEAK